MAKKRPITKCKLCGEVEELCDSHYLPRSLYKITMARELKNPNPVMSVNGRLKQVSAQYRGFVFCTSCEDLLNKKGEKWLLANLPKNDGGYPLQDALVPLTPTLSVPRCDRYNVSGVKPFDLEKLVYFATSVFWRGAVHGWETTIGQKAPPVDLGVYLEPMRRFLLGEPFPDNVVLTVEIWPYKPVVPLIQPVISEQLSQTVRRYWFCIPGLYCFLFAGDIPKDVRDSHIARGVVTVDADVADSILKFFKDGLLAQIRGAEIEAMFKEIESLRKQQKK
jgi:hypothetical protein